ncbi:O-antigen translocase [Cyanobium sp. Candia 9D4]|uniref:O-antigen translocase n=1 Tax=Cyanobium sp. Candia 9D4 TaxID=2823707 RepID=UPI0020CD3CEE|nr:O-antigen translocase [Cyanobium sp. Candia 9D4]MCP9932295.1 O-antigen translocase [Cyanobium sp. Candia 9D4]
MTQPSMPSTETNALETGSPVADTRGSFRGIFKASALIGSSALIGAVLGAFRAKTLAVLIGPAGIGLMGGFTVILDLAISISQLGLNQSGVRQIAEAAGSGEERRLAVAAYVLRRTTLLSAIVGAIILWASSGAVSKLTFGTKDHADSIALLSVALFLTVVSHAQGALLQATRRTKDVAKLHIYAGLLGTIFVVSIIYFAGVRGIVPSMVAAAIASIVLSWWLSRKVRTVKVVIKAGEAARESALLLQLGLAFLASGLLTTGAAFVVRTFIIRTLGLDAAGIYQAAWTLGGLYVGFVLNALCMDFYPRLVGIINDHRACNATVNEQTIMSFIMAAPGILATITLAPLIIYLFYSAKFVGAVVLLQWICIGMAIRIIFYPVAYIIIASNHQFIYFAVEAAWATMNIVFTWWGLKNFGLEGAGIAFLVTNIFHGLIIYNQARSMTGFQWSAGNLRAGTYFLLACISTFLAQRALPQWPALAFGTCLTLASLWFCTRTMVTLTGTEDRLPGIRKYLHISPKP